jgi:hypothetical protein
MSTVGTEEDDKSYSHNFHLRIWTQWLPIGRDYLCLFEVDIVSW